MGQTVQASPDPLRRALHRLVAGVNRWTENLPELLAYRRDYIPEYETIIPMGEEFQWEEAKRGLES